uniref:Uncharacterized protein n=1 Tax=Physcomitrium patens TaxID=3218 RepID=A0A2K1JUP3_PHYPA|nr:hypothetical protein PHYPA_015006 [Physcomitrium patens]
MLVDADLTVTMRQFSERTGAESASDVDSCGLAAVLASWFDRLYGPWRNPVDPSPFKIAKLIPLTVVKWSLFRTERGIYPI